MTEIVSLITVSIKLVSSVMTFNFIDFTDSRVVAGSILALDKFCDPQNMLVLDVIVRVICIT